MRIVPLLALLAACVPPEIERAPVSEDTRDAIAQVNDFGMRFAVALRDAQPEGAASNLVYSPLSAGVPLSMVYAGARGTTADEMRTVLGQAMDDTAYQGGFAAAVRDLADAGAQHPDRVWELRASNHLYGEASYPFEDDWLALLEEEWAAPLVATDFKGNPSGARQQINAQVAEDTEGHIADLLPADAITDITKLAAVNALYFAGKWETAFEVEDTRDAAFTLLDGTVIEVPTMRATLPGKAACDEVACIAELPYIGGQMVLDLIVPVAHDGLPALEDAIAADGLDYWLDGLVEQEELNVALPRMDLTSDVDLKAPLVAMGMPTAFHEQEADFSGISPLALQGDTRLFVDKALQRTWVHIDEQGTKAASATAITLSQDLSLEMTAQVLADRPFLLLIRDTVTGAVLFVGHVADPSLAE